MLIFRSYVKLLVSVISVLVDFALPHFSGDSKYLVMSLAVRIRRFRAASDWRTKYVSLVFQRPDEHTHVFWRVADEKDLPFYLKEGWGVTVCVSSGVWVEGLNEQLLALLQQMMSDMDPSISAEGFQIEISFVRVPKLIERVRAPETLVTVRHDITSDDVPGISSSDYHTGLEASVEGQ